MPQSPLHVVFTGGGTGGHLFPGLAVAEQLIGHVPRVRITFVGSGKRFERRHVALAGFEYLGLPCRPLSGRMREMFSFAIGNLAGYLAAGHFLDEERVAAVVGLGGYASFPMALAASRRGVPLVLLEQNAVPGRATRWLSRSATLVCAAMAKTLSNFQCRCPVRLTGNPIRAGFDQFSHSHALSHSRVLHGNVPSLAISTIPALHTGSTGAASSPCKRLVVLGGSGGANVLNENIPRALHKIRTELAGWEIVHQSGEADLQQTCELYRKLSLPATVVAFLDHMPLVLAAGGVAVCRAGGTTLAELAVAGVPALLVPYPHAVGDHQRRNAEVFSSAGASIILDQRELPGRFDDHLAAALSRLLGDPAGRKRMSAAMRRLARPHAAAEVADLILQIVERPSENIMPAAA